MKFFLCVKVIIIEMFRPTHNWRDKDTHSHLLPEAAEKEDSYLLHLNLRMQFCREWEVWILVPSHSVRGCLTVIMERWNENSTTENSESCIYSLVNPVIANIFLLALVTTCTWKGRLLWFSPQIISQQHNREWWHLQACSFVFSAPIFLFFNSLSSV